MQLEVVATYLVYHLFHLCSTLMNKYSLFSLWMESCYSLSYKVLDFFLLFAMRVVIRRANESFSSSGFVNNITKAHWEELLQSVSNFIFRLTISKHCGCTPRVFRGVKRSEILWGIQKYSLPGRPSTIHWVK